MVDSNWSWSEEAGQYYFHRFYPFQPDLNYGEPAVTAAMCRVLAGWRIAGVQGFRLDAAPMLWKKEGTTCEGLPETHLVLKIFRAALDLLGADVLLLAEANQPAPALREYFGDGDECNAAFHFPLLPLIWKALVEEDPGALLQARFPGIPPDCSWFTFLRCHDELTLELLPPQERARVAQTLCRQPSWSFRGGLGVSGRLFELLDRDPDWTVLAFSVLLSLAGTPVLYYGDELAATNNESYYQLKARSTGFPDSRFLHRGPLEPGSAEQAASNPDSPAGRVLRGLRRILRARAVIPGLAGIPPALSTAGPVLIAERRAAGHALVAFSNLSGRPVEARGHRLAPHECLWEVG
jgi:maltose alpha-D-glucosyltransferase/alpha-amylase